MKDLLKTELKISPYTAIFKLAWPQVLMMFAHFLIGFVDVWVAGKLGRSVQACMGITTQALFFFLVVAIAFANGSVAAISQSMGAGLYKRIQRFVGLGLIIGVVIGFLFFVMGFFLKSPLLNLLNVPQEISEIAGYLFGVYLLILPAYYLFIISNAVFRAQQRVMYPLYAMILVTLVNTFGDLGFGLGWWGLPYMGYKGLAWSTFGAILCGCLFNISMLIKHRLLVRRSFAPWRWVRCAFPYLFKVAWPAGLLQIVWHSAYMALFAITASLPEESVAALAGMSAGLRVESLFFLPAFAFNFTAAILVGNHLGAENAEEARRCGYRILGVGMAVIALETAVFWNFLDSFAGFVASDPKVHEVALTYLKYNLVGLPFILITMVLGGAFTGAGATMLQMIVVGSSAWLVRIPLAWWLGHRVYQEPTGIWMAMLCSMILQAVVMLAVYQFRDWPRYALRARRLQGK